MQKAKLSTALIESLGFTLVNWKISDDSSYPFGDMMEMPYYAKESVLLFFNTSGPMEPDAFLLGYGDIRCGNYHMAQSRWLHYEDEVRAAYEVLTGKTLK
jgi:hypothetical protein